MLKTEKDLHFLKIKDLGKLFTGKTIKRADE